MTVRKTTLLITVAALALGALLAYGTQGLALLRSFARLERQETLQNVERVRRVLNEEVGALATEAGDYASWDDTYAFVARPRPDHPYVSANLTDVTFAKLRLSFMVFVDRSGRIVHAKWFDLERGREAPVPVSLTSWISSDRTIWNHSGVEGCVSGLMVLPEGPVLFASRPILTRASTGPIRGALVLGRMLGPQEIQRLSEIVHVSVTVRSVAGALMSPDLARAAQYLTPKTPTYVRAHNARLVAGYGLVEDYAGHPGVIVRVELPRVIYQQGRVTLVYSILHLTGVILALGAMAFALLSRFVVSRIERLSLGVSNIGASRDLRARVSLGGRDELAGLAAAINEMLEVLEEGQRKLQESEERYRTLVENQGEGVATVGADGAFTFANPAAHQILGVAAGSLAGRGLCELADAGEWRALVEEAQGCPPGSRVTRELSLRLPDGAGRTILLTATPRFDAVGQPDGLLIVFRDITSQKEAEAKIKHLSFHDGLTGLYNRAYFEEELERLDTQRQLPLSVVMGDVNGLKLVNDAFGHAQGDRLLVQIAGIVARCCRREDIVCRFGGDEFALLLPRTSERAAMDVTSRIRRACDQAPDDPIRPSIALAVATKNHASESIRDVLRQAEDRMYRNKLVEGKSARSSIVSSLQRTLGAKTHETEEHARRLQDLGLAVGRALGLPDSLLDEIALLAVLHDVGKIAVPDNVLTKPGSLTEHEWEAIRKHPEVGYRIAAFSEGVAPVAEAILAHHERWDGTGYPRGLKGPEIPIISRIIAIADAYDVMTRGRPYKPAVSREEALNELERCAGTQFDPELVRTFVAIVAAPAPLVAPGQVSGP